ncbi:MAG: hypothetical protein WCJ37_05755 [Syntrophus sp. (in: bacteria)]
MSEHIEILKEIKSGGYEASLITTFNAYLPFYEDVVLRHLMGNGVRHNVLMMDASQASLAVGRHPPRSAGRYYTLAPIKVSGAFHPKIILLVGKKKGTLLVGSHNLTLSGFGYNREMSNLIHYRDVDDAEVTTIFTSVWQSVLSWAESESYALPGQIIDMIKRVQDFAPWFQNSTGTLSERCCVLSSTHDAVHLWQQLITFAGIERVKRVIISGAFFDANLSFIKRVRDELAPEELFVGIDPASVQFPVGSKLPGVSFVNCARLAIAENDDKQGGYLHAKSLLIQREDGEIVLAVGSANPSYPAWLASGITQNIELMIARKGEDAKEAAEQLGLTGISSMPPLTDEEWALVKQNWERKGEPSQNDAATQIFIAIVTDDQISFRIPGIALPPVIDCEITTSVASYTVTRQARLIGSEYLLSNDGINPPASFIRFKIDDKHFTGLIQYVKQIEGLARTDSQRKFHEALASLTTGSPNLEYFVECIKDIIKINDAVIVDRAAPGSAPQRKTDDMTADHREGAGLSIGLDEVVERNHLRKQRLRSSDGLGYLLDVLLYNLRDENPVCLDIAMEGRDVKGRSEEEQIDADDEEVIEPLQTTTSQNNTLVTSDRNPLDVCHYKVGSLVSAACDKLDALKQGRLDLSQLVVIMAAILSTLRLLRGLDSKVPWIGVGQTAVPQKELRKYFHKIAEVVYDGGKSIICLDSKYSLLKDADEFARLKGLIIWLAWESGISLTKKKPFNESREEYATRFNVNRLYVATAQLIAGDEDVIREAKQSIGQLGSIDIDWFDGMLDVDMLFRDACAGSTPLKNGSMAKSGDFGFNSVKPEIGIREVLARDTDNRSLSCHNSNQPRFIFPVGIIRLIPFDQIFNASQLSRSTLLIDKTKF